MRKIAVSPMPNSFPSSHDQDRVMAILALLRGETSAKSLADKFEVTVDDIHQWQADFIAGGTHRLVREQPRMPKAATIDLAALHAVSQSLAAILDVDDLIGTSVDNLHWVF